MIPFSEDHVNYDEQVNESSKSEGEAQEDDGLLVDADDENFDDTL